MNKTKAFMRAAMVAAATIFTFTGCSMQKSSPAPKPILEVESKPPILIEPNVRVDNVRRGMSEQQVEAALGQPQKKNKNGACYFPHGIIVSFDKDGVVRSVQCYKPFAGVTKEGIGIGSTRAELIKAYGTPDQDQHFAHGGENLSFPNLRTSFYLENDKITSFIVHW